MYDQSDANLYVSLTKLTAIIFEIEKFLEELRSIFNSTESGEWPTIAAKAVLLQESDEMGPFSTPPTERDWALLAAFITLAIAAALAFPNPI